MDERSRELQISLRLKAARWLAGSERVRANSKTGKPEAIALPIPDLAKRSPLPENRIRANKLTEIEEMKTYVTPSQLALISEALGVDLESLPLLPATTGPGESAALPGPPAGPLPETTKPAESPRPAAADGLSTAEGAAARGDA